MSLSASPRANRAPQFFELARFNMIESQLRPNGVLSEQLLSAFTRLPREAFVAEEAKSFSYSDEEIACGFGRKMLSPMVFARLVQEANIGPTERVLDVGAATGYSSAVLNDMAGEVVALESDPALCRLLQQNAKTFELEHLRIVQGNLNDGHPPASPYHAIFIQGGVQWLPDSLLAQLAEGGRLLCVMYPAKTTLPGQLGHARLYQRKGGRIEMRDLFDAAAPMLSAFAARPGFEF